MRYYENKIDQQNGPAMSYAIFAVQYARMQEPEKAYQMFLKSFVPHERPPFGVLAETPTSQNPYFMTGAGGLLQAVLFGFGGLTIDASASFFPTVTLEILDFERNRTRSENLCMYPLMKWVLY